VALLGWIRAGRDGPTIAPSAARAALTAAADDLLDLPWKTAGELAESGVSGDVVWSDARQEGYMRFRNLPRNEPTAEQYQLWIFDQEQSLDTPVDGGVFDIDASGELVVPIDAKLEVHEALAFAVTVEKPGGVVVSDRTRLILTAGL
jgi:anti-sigma-K factor RskA